VACGGVGGCNTSRRKRKEAKGGKKIHFEILSSTSPIFGR